MHPVDLKMWISTAINQRRRKLTDNVNIHNNDEELNALAIVQPPSQPFRQTPIFFGFFCVNICARSFFLPHSLSLAGLLCMRRDSTACLYVRKIATGLVCACRIAGGSVIRCMRPDCDRCVPSCVCVYLRSPCFVRSSRSQIE